MFQIPGSLLMIYVTLINSDLLGKKKRINTAAMFTRMISCQFKMQFKVIASVLLFFVAQTQSMAIPNPCMFTTSTFHGFALTAKTNHTFFVDTVGYGNQFVS